MDKEDIERHAIYLMNLTDVFKATCYLEDLLEREDDFDYDRFTLTGEEDEL